MQAGKDDVTERLQDWQMKPLLKDDSTDASQQSRRSLSSLRPIIFLSCIGYIFLVAFWSYYISYPGLISANSGIEPVSRHLPYAAPWLYKTLLRPPNNMIDADSFCEILCLVGIAIACVVAPGLCQHGLLFVLMTTIYSVLTKAGGVFYSFQWDILLLETGTVIALCYAPWRTTRPLTVRSQTEEGSSTCIGVCWPVRYLLFKLMFMSGVVKIQADCPTWNNLTALEYHFATQCLPGPFAWYVHQFHPLFLRLSVAATFWIEIPMAFLLLAPTYTIRRMSAWFQILLQVTIILTGNYNFFNLLTMALCLPCLQRDEKEILRNRRVEQILLWAYAAWTIQKMFVFRLVPPAVSWWRDLSISLIMTKTDCDELSEWAVPVMTLLAMALVVWSTAQRIRDPLSIVRGTVCIVTIGVLAVPMCSLTPVLQQNTFFGANQLFTPLWLKYARPHRLVNGYGLFRRMTGVGAPPPRSENDESWGWAGLPPSIVERPEIILEGVFDDGGGTDTVEKWQELSFRWKPGDPRAMPRQVAPHQPRLDWQMWFAALGSPQQNLWFTSLIKKLLDNCESVKHLLGHPELMSKNLTKIRAKLYHYDMTRIDSEWTRGIPGFVNVTAPPPTEEGGFWSPWMQAFTRRPDRYWTRKFVRPYLGTIGANDPNLERHLQAYGYKSVCRGSKDDRCHLHTNVWCEIASQVRMRSLHLAPIVLLLMCHLIQLRRHFLSRTRG